jgi:hypothetical protein
LFDIEFCTSCEGWKFLNLQGDVDSSKILGFFILKKKEPKFFVCIHVYGWLGGIVVVISVVYIGRKISHIGH